MGYKMFNRVGYGLESPSAPGTIVPCTSPWYGTLKVPQDAKPVYPPFSFASPIKSAAGMIYQRLVDGLVLAGPENATYWEMLPLMLSIFLHGGLTPVEKTTGQGDYVWKFLKDGETGSELADYPFALDSASLEYGDEAQAWNVQFVTGRRLNLSGAYGQDQAVKAELEGFGSVRSLNPEGYSTPDPATLPAGLHPINADLVQLKVDEYWAGRGTTPAANLHDWNFELLNGAVPKWHGSDILFDTVQQSYLDWLLTLTLEHDAGGISAGIMDKAETQTPMAFSLKLLGDQIGTGDPHSLLVNFWGTPEQWLPMDGDDNGLNLDKYVIHPLVDVDEAGEENSLEVVLTVDMATVDLPGGA